MEELMKNQNDLDVITTAEEITSYVDWLVSTTNPAIAADGSDAQNAPLPKTKPHVCNKSYLEIEDHKEDLVDLIATCQRHTRCSTAYCLRKKKGKLTCRFGYPKPLQPVTTLVEEKGVLNVLTERNDSLLNSYNDLQLSGWRANVDTQPVVSKDTVVGYIAKYASKPECRSKGLKAVYGNL